ncbi:MAG: amino acid ABC transporter permease [Herbinix sp.]|nr:amino acid ABC transporter permease [Herbinix sp.]
MDLFSFTRMVDMFFKYHKLFLSGIGMTLLLSLITVVISTIFGTMVALLRMSRIKLIRFIVTTYIEIFRSTPLMVQVMVIYFGAAAFGWKINISFIKDFNAFFWGLLVLVLNSSAYVSEIVRSGINAVDAGQTEAARSIGMSKGMAMRLVILPQAVRNILPALMNEFVAIIKETSIVSLCGISEIMFRAKDVIAISYRTLEPYVIAAILYFIIVFPLSKIVSQIERRLNASVTR